MEYKNHVHFAGEWERAEQEIVARAVTAHEAILDESPNADAEAPWVCLRVTLGNEALYLAYRLGQEDFLKATSATFLAEKIQDSSANQTVEGSAQETLISPGGIPPYRLRKVIDFVRSNLDCPVTVAQMAGKARMSEAHFSRLFKQSLGLTPLQYVTQCRIEHAERLLLNTDLKITEIVQRIGLRSASHFAEIFKKQTGMTPREYRNRYYGQQLK